MRTVIALVLSLVLAIGSVSMAVAHGQAPMGDGITICTAEGTVTVSLDADGNPVPAAPHLCPDCLSAGSAFLLNSGPTLPERPAQSATARRVLVACDLRSLTLVTAQARAPPVLDV